MTKQVKRENFCVDCKYYIPDAGGERNCTSFGSVITKERGANSCFKVRGCLERCLSFRKKVKA